MFGNWRALSKVSCVSGHGTYFYINNFKFALSTAATIIGRCLDSSTEECIWQLNSACVDTGYRLIVTTALLLSYKSPLLRQWFDHITCMIRMLR